MKISVEYNPGITARWAKTVYTNEDIHRYSSLEYTEDGSICVSYFTPKGHYFTSKWFDSNKYETAWRVMFRTAIGEKA
jgi:hypothetical protein